MQGNAKESEILKQLKAGKGATKGLAAGLTSAEAPPPSSKQSRANNDDGKKRGSKGKKK